MIGLRDLVHGIAWFDSIGRLATWLWWNIRRDADHVTGHNHVGVRNLWVCSDQCIQWNVIHLCNLIHGVTGFDCVPRTLPGRGYANQG